VHLLDQVRDFYMKVLGLQQGSRPPFQFAGYWLYAGNEAVLHLAAAREGQEFDTRLASIDHVALACKDYEGTCQHLESLGIQYRSMQVPVLEHRQIFFRDPLGNGIELNFSG
jgi:glyoxylase I family protein